MTRKLCFLSSKGGSGKTTTAAALGTLISILGKSVLIVDTDASTNGMTLLYLNQLIGNKKSADGDCHGLFDDASAAIDKISISDDLAFIPATYHMADTAVVDESLFSSALESVLTHAAKELYDFVILDAQAGTDEFARISAEAADDIIIVSEYDPLSAQGTDRLKAVLAASIDPSQTWVLFNKVLPEFASLVGDGLSIARYLPPIPWDPDVVRALARRDIAIDMIDPNPYTLSIMAIANELYRDELGHDISEWKQKVLSTTVDPIEEKLREVSAEIERASYFRYESSRRKQFFYNIATGLGAVLTGTAAFALSFVDSGSANLSIERTALWSGLASGIGALSVAAAIYLSLRRRPKPDLESFRLGRLRAERDRLRTARDASRSALESIGKSGFYGQKRQDA